MTIQESSGVWFCGFRLFQCVGGVCVVLISAYATQIHSFYPGRPTVVLSALVYGVYPSVLAFLITTLPPPGLCSPHKCGFI